MMRRPQSGFAYIAAVILLVVVAGIAVALLRLTDTQQGTVNGALLGARANLAARGGIEWAFFSLNQACVQLPTAANVPAPAVTPTVLGDFRQASGFTVSVSCTFREYGEGESMDLSDPADPKLDPVRKRIYRIVSTACNGSTTACPDPGSVPLADYVERSRVATLCQTSEGKFCN